MQQHGWGGQQDLQDPTLTDGFVDNLRKQGSCLEPSQQRLRSPLLPFEFAELYLERTKENKAAANYAPNESLRSLFPGSQPGSYYILRMLLYKLFYMGPYADYSIENALLGSQRSRNQVYHFAASMGRWRSRVAEESMLRSEEKAFILQGAL